MTTTVTYKGSTLTTATNQTRTLTTSGKYLEDNITITDVSGGGGSPTLETVTKTYTPSTSAVTDTITPSAGYDGIEEVDVTVSAVPSGTAGTPTATKGAVNNHSISVTPSVTNTTGYITGSTKTGTAVSVSASELVSGSETKTSNGTYDVTNLAQLVVNVSGGGGLVYESGTYTPSEDVAQPTIYFTNAHTNRPFFVMMVDTSSIEYNTNDSLMFCIVNWYDLFGSSLILDASNTYYARVQVLYKTSTLGAGGWSIGYLSGATNASYMDYWLTNTYFRPYTNSATRYWRAGNTYKWVAVWGIL